MGKIEGIEFGYFYHKDPARPIVDYANAEEYVYKEGIAHACPQSRQVVEDFGAEWTLERYVSCDVAMDKLVLEPAEYLNPELYKKILTPVQRRSDEPVGHYQEGSVPESHKYVMSPGSTIYGYAIPREIIAAIGRNEKGRIAPIHERLPKIVDMVEDAIKVSMDPYELLTRIAEGSMEIGADSKELLSHMFSRGILKEENCVSQYKTVEFDLKQYAPKLWEIYSGMSESDKAANDMWAGSL